MLNDFEQDITILTKIGLTPLQAQVYLTLAKLTEASIKSLSVASNVDRANVYRVLIRLQDLGLVEKLLTNPTVFRALSINEGVRMLLDQKELVDQDIKNKTVLMLKKYETHSEEALIQTRSEFTLLPDGKLMARKVAEMVKANEKTHEIIIYWSDFSHQVQETVERWSKLLVRGVKLRIIVFLQPKERIPKNVLDMQKNSGFEIRQTLTPPKSTISIIDGNQALLSVNPALNPRGKPGLWVNNHGVVGLVQEYFEMVWQKSKSLS
jgi:sugar-specific transcriptional regulator TrmB